MNMNTKYNQLKLNPVKMCTALCTDYRTFYCSRKLCDIGSVRFGCVFFRNSVVMNFDHFQTRRPLPLLLSPSFFYDQIHPDRLIQYDLFFCLLKFSPRDNVHLTEMGYKVLTGKIVQVAKELKERQAKHQQPDDPLSGREIISWCSFYTTIGCGKRSELKAPVKKGFRAHPYRR